MFGLNFDEVKTNMYTWDNPLLSNMANGKCQSRYRLADLISKAIGINKNVVDYVDIKDNIASPKLTAFEDLKKQYSYYTDNDKQNKILSLIKDVADNVKELEKLGFDRIDLINIFYNDLSVNPYLLKRF